MLRPLLLGLLVQRTGWLGAEVRGREAQGDDEARDRGRKTVIHKNFQRPMFIWSTMHGLASIKQANVMEHQDLAPKAGNKATEHIMHMLSLALAARQP